MDTRTATSVYLPVDRLVGGYLLITAAALAFPNRPTNWPVLLAVHLAAATLMLYAPRAGADPLAWLWPRARVSCARPTRCSCSPRSTPPSRG